LSLHAAFSCGGCAGYKTRKTVEDADEDGDA